MIMSAVIDEFTLKESEDSNVLVYLECVPVGDKTKCSIVTKTMDKKVVDEKGVYNVVTFHRVYVIFQNGEIHARHGTPGGSMRCKVKNGVDGIVLDCHGISPLKKST